MISWGLWLQGAIPVSTERGQDSAGQRDQGARVSGEEAGPTAIQQTAQELPVQGWPRLHPQPCTDGSVRQVMTERVLPGAPVNDVDFF